MFVILLRLCQVLLISGLLSLVGCYKKNQKPKPKQPTEYHSKRAGQRKQQRIERLASEYKPTLSKMEQSELKERYEQLLASNNTHAALKYLERLIPITKNDAEKERLILLTADLYFGNSDYEKAEAKYSLYETLFPGGKNAQKSAYSKTLCSFYRTLSYDHDQKLTQHTLDYAKEFLNVQSFKEYRSEVENIVNLCYGKLFDHEKDIIEQKFNLGTPESLRAAKIRLAYIKDTLVEECPSLTEQYAQLEKECGPFIARAAAPESDKAVFRLAQNEPEKQKQLRA